MIFSLFWEGAFIRRGAFILKSEILGGVHSRGRLFEAGRLFEEILSFPPGWARIKIRNTVFWGPEN